MKQYASAPHPRIPIYQGEIHLLSNCLLCHNRRALLLLPAESVTRAELHRHTGRNQLVLALRLVCLDGQSRRLELVAAQRKRIGKILAYLEDQKIPIHQ